MSLYSAMYSGISGLSAQSRSLGIISENIANVNTVGYKGNRTQFSSLVTGQWGGGTHSSSGVRASAGSLIRQQGLLQSTGSATDMGLSGDGFFVVNSGIKAGAPAGEFLFTRAGSFQLDDQRNLVNTAGLYLTGWKVDGEGRFVDDAGRPITPDPTSMRDLHAINLGGLEFTAQATRQVGLNANLPANAKVADSYQTSVQVYDAVGTSHHAKLDWQKVDALAASGRLDPAASPVVVTRNLTDSTGASHPVTLTYTATATNAWSLTASTADGTITGGPVALAFDDAGKLTSAAGAELVIDWKGAAKDSTVSLDLSGMEQGQGGQVTTTLNPDGAVWKLSVATDDTGDQLTAGAATYVTFNRDGTLRSPANHSFTVNWDDSDSLAADSTIVLDLGTPGAADGMSSFGESYTIASITQDGLAFGAFSGVRVGEDGLVTALFDNGQSRPVYKIPVARFPASEALATRSGNAYQQTGASGAVFLNESGVGGAGEVIGQTLEASTVDLATEFTNMITTQRAYSANATIITTADEMLEELNRIKR